MSATPEITWQGSGEDYCALCDHQWPYGCALAECDCGHEAGEVELGARDSWRRFAAGWPTRG